MYYCKLCSYTTIRLSNLRRHMAVHQKEYVGHLKCSLCNYRSTRKQNVARHLIKKHGGKGDIVTGGEIDGIGTSYSETTFVANYQCNVCSYSSTNKQNVLSHQSTEHTAKGDAVTGKAGNAPKLHPDPNPDPLPDPYPVTSADPQQKIIFAANFQCSVCNYRNAKKENVIKHQYSKHGGDDDAMIETDRQINPDIYSVPETIQVKEEDDESEPAKRLLLAECGLIWHSDKFLKKERSVDDSDPSTTWMHS